MQNKFKVNRPLLNVHRVEIRQFVRFWKLPIYSDQSNQKTNYLRNKIRKQLMPTLRIFFNPQIDTILLNFVQIQKDEQLYFQNVLKFLLTPHECTPLFAFYLVFHFTYVNEISVINKSNLGPEDSWLTSYEDLLTSSNQSIKSSIYILFAYLLLLFGPKHLLPTAVKNNKQLEVNAFQEVKEVALGFTPYAPLQKTKLRKLRARYPFLLKKFNLLVSFWFVEDSYKKMYSFANKYNQKTGKKDYTPIMPRIQSGALGALLVGILRHSKQLEVNKQQKFSTYNRNQILYWLIINNNLIKRLNSYPNIFQKKVLKTILKTFNQVENVISESRQSHNITNFPRYRNAVNQKCKKIYPAKQVSEKKLTQLIILKFTKKLFVLREKRFLLFIIQNLININK